MPAKSLINHQHLSWSSSTDSFHFLFLYKLFKTCILKSAKISEYWMQSTDFKHRTHIWKNVLLVYCFLSSCTPVIMQNIHQKVVNKCVSSILMGLFLVCLFAFAAAVNSSGAAPTSQVSLEQQLQNLPCLMLLTWFNGSLSRNERVEMHRGRVGLGDHQSCFDQK